MEPVDRPDPASAAPENRNTRRRERTRQALLDGALRAIAADGVEATTITDITHAADVGVGSFYNHFESKEDIVEAVAAMIGHEWTSAVQEVLDSDAAGDEKLAAVLDKAAAFPDVDHALVAFTVATSGTSTSLAATMGTTLGLAVAVCSADGTVDVDPEPAAWVLGGAMLSVWSARRQNRLGPIQARRALVELGLRSCGVSTERAAELADRTLG